MRGRTGSALGVPALLAAGGAIGGCSMTPTYGTGQAPEMALFREMTGGLTGEKKEPIRYQPRAPLVLPPAAGQLPAPVETAEAADAAWPRDFDKPPEAEEVAWSDSFTPDNSSAAEYRRLRPLAEFGNSDWEARDTQRKLGAREQREAFEKALADAKGFNRTERRYLTDPPIAYREPAASAPTEFEDIEGGGGNWLTGIFRRGRS